MFFVYLCGVLLCLSKDEEGVVLEWEFIGDDEEEEETE